MERRLKLLAVLVPLFLILSTFANAQTENLFPNGIGQGSYKGVKLVAVTQTGTAGRRTAAGVQGAVGKEDRRLRGGPDIPLR